MNYPSRNQWRLKMTAKAIRRKEREREGRKQEVLVVALALFAEKGFHSVSMQEIAEVAEFSVGTLYNLFENKDSLFEELMENTKERMREDLFVVLDVPGDAVQRIRHFIRSTSDLLEEYATFIKVHVSQLGKKGSKAAKMEDDFNAIMNAKLAEIFATGISQGLFRRVDPLITAQALGAVIETLAFEMAGHFDRNVATEKFTKVEQLFLDGLLAV
jgi:AcrR family transcriptional regulator